MKHRSAPIAIGGIAAAIVLGATAGGSQAPAPATAAAKHRHHRPPRTHLATSKDLWATINVCDTADAANTIGIRGSQPGLGNRRSRLVMRFRVQYKAKTDGKWHYASGPDTDSGWRSVGRTRSLVIESGQNFEFMPPTDGGSHLLRGVVRFRWIRQGEVVARQLRFTEPGHRTTAGADPKGYSAAQCEITPP
ncbi:MAG: hypothetical protein QOI80_849 [Solirubrobacteraceae bacterium]|jgi:hypothetical protein|nr:hypothetical protein [Solirubrobacteraceae bacterium]